MFFVAVKLGDKKKRKKIKKSRTILKLTLKDAVLVTFILFYYFIWEYCILFLLVNNLIKTIFLTIYFITYINL